MGTNPLVDVDIFSAMFRTQLKMAFYTKKLSGQIIISVDHPPVLILDPDGSARDVLLPPEANSKGLLFYIYNTAGGQPEILTIKDDSGSDTIMSLDQTEVGLVYCDGAKWRGFRGFSTDITATVAELNILDGLLATTAELNNVADVSGRVQELTADGAVVAGVQSLELNDTGAIVAATIADAVNHQGLFIVKNTSASGVRAHTLTLTSGTFNGTANVATLNAPKEALAVYFDSAGNGTIIENVGAVGLA